MASGERGQRGADEGNGMGGDGSAGPDDVTGGLPGPDAGKQAAGGSGARAEDDLAGRLLGGRYRVTGRIGRGGMGVVCRAVDEVLGREVAVKVLRAYTDASAPELADLRTRMQREARAAARIRHSGVITVHDVIDEGGRPVIVMELVDGPSLDDAVGRRGGIEPREMAAIGARVMDALDAAHRAGVLHRDVKPGNVLLDSSGRVVLTDFGIASIEAPGDGAETNITRSGELVGSLDYLPPERAQGMGPSPASDIWSLGMTLYAAVEGGTAPFRRTSVYSTLTAIVTEPLPEPQRAGPLTPVLHALMAKNPADRPDAARAREMLQAVADGGDPGAMPVPGAPHLPTATDIKPVGPPPPPRPFGAAATGGNGSGAPTGWLSGPGAAGSSSQAPSGGPEPVHDQPTAVVGAVAASRSARDTAPLPRPRRGGRIALAVAAVLVVLATGGGVTYLMVGDKGEPSARGGASAPADGDAGRATEPGAPISPDAKSSDKGGDKNTATDGGAGNAGESPGGEPSRTEEPSDDTSSPADEPSTGDGGHGGGAEGGNGSGDPTGGGSTPPPETSCTPGDAGKTNCVVWRTADSYTASGQKAGVVNGGTNYFYCQANLGRRETSGRWTNVWWAKTDDDSGNTGVFISVVYLKGGANDQPMPGLPVC
ncbi:protein kinase [Streptomyces sp. NBC_01525]|uniref:serine/threonine-protein kinase n=1 Tax=Streptomyces sp. NBC_01525 TaxID=2903893 RepID=UPI00387096BE